MDQGRNGADEGGRWRGPQAASSTERVLLVVLAAVILAVFVALIRVPPDPRGYGTHEALGMSPCSWPMLYHQPCPTCGVTTAACLLLHLRPIDAVRVQPFGVAFTLGGMLFALLALRHAWRGESLFARLARWPLLRITLGYAVLLLLSWWYCSFRFTAR